MSADQVAIPRNADDTKLIAMCDLLAALNKDASAAWNSVDDDRGDKIFDAVHSLLDKIIATKPETEEGMRRKATIMFNAGAFYQWTNIPGHVELSDRVVAALLRDLG